MIHHDPKIQQSKLWRCDPNSRRAAQESLISITVKLECSHSSTLNPDVYGCVLVSYTCAGGKYFGTSWHTLQMSTDWHRLACTAAHWQTLDHIGTMVPLYILDQYIRLSGFARKEIAKTLRERERERDRERDDDKLCFCAG